MYGRIHYIEIVGAHNIRVGGPKGLGNKPVIEVATHKEKQTTTNAAKPWIRLTLFSWSRRRLVHSTAAVQGLS